MAVATANGHGDRPSVITPDAVGLDLEVATLGSRGVAYILDLLVLVVGLTLLFFAQAAFGLGGFVPDWFGIALLLVLAFGWQFGYPIGFETLLRGRTPGKAVMGLRVVTAEGAPVGVRHSAIRAIVAVLELTGTLGAVAVITSFASSRGQRLGDLAAGTLVIRERRAAGRPTVEVFAAPAGLEGYVRQLDVSGLQSVDYATIRDTLRRAPQLPADARVRVTTDLARTVLPRVAPAPPQGVRPELFLWCVASAVQARRPASAQAPAASRPTAEIPPNAHDVAPASAPGSAPPGAPAPLTDPATGSPSSAPTSGQDGTQQASGGFQPPA